MANDCNDNSPFSTPPRSRQRPTSIDSYHSIVSFDSYRSTASSFASSTYVHPPSITSLSDLTDTGQSGDGDPNTSPDHQIDSDVDIPFFCVLCMYDFDSDDPDHTPFKENDILKIIAQEPSGWWAAQVGEHVGWIPSAFVAVIPHEMVETLRKVPHEMRVYEYKAEALYNGAPLSGLTLDGDSTPPRDHFSFDNDDQVQVLTTSSKLLSPSGFPTDVTPGFPRFDIPADLPSLQSPLSAVLVDSRHDARQSRTYPTVPLTPRTPRTPVPPKGPAPEPASTSNAASQVRPRFPQLTLNTTPLMVNKPTPPTPISSTPLSSNYSASPSLPRSRSFGSSSSSLSSLGRRRPNSQYISPASLRTLIETPLLFSSSSTETEFTSPEGSQFSRGTASGRPDKVWQITGDDDAQAFHSARFGHEFTSPEGSQFSRGTASGRPDKVWQITGDDDAQAFHSARLAQAMQPWYLKPDHLGDDIKLEYDGSVRAGTLEALVERLTIEPLKLEQEVTFRHTFLTTFRTFSTADRVLELLIERYELEAPANLQEEQFNEWKEKKLRPAQARILHVFTVWVEQHGMIEDDPQIIPRLRDFLELVRSPPALANCAKSILLNIDRRRHSDIDLPSLASTALKRGSTKKFLKDFLRIDPSELARQLTLYEARLYLKVRPHECLTWSSTQKGDIVQSLRSFVSTSDKVAAWVKMSVLGNDALGKRADAIELWIKVAEKCRTLNNFSTMSAIVAALTSPVIAKLQLTWAHVNKASHVEPLVKLSEPTNNFATYRQLFSSIAGACLPYIGIYLSDMVKVSETAPNFIKVPATESAPEMKLINFVKRQKMSEVTHTILRHQPQVRDLYKITEVPHVFQYVELQLRIAAGKDEGSFWLRSEEVQHAELAHADIRKGLEAAGF